MEWTYDWCGARGGPGGRSQGRWKFRGRILRSSRTSSGRSCSLTPRKVPVGVSSDSSPFSSFRRNSRRSWPSRKACARRGSPAELRDDHRLPRLVEADEGHVRGEHLARRERVGTAARHRHVDAHAALGGVGNPASAEGDVLPHTDRIPQLDPIDGRGHHRSATVAGRRRAPRPRPSTRAPCRASKSRRNRRCAAHPLVQMDLVARASLLHARECSGL